jgi:hypothetical protein
MNIHFKQVSKRGNMNIISMEGPAVPRKVHSDSFHFFQIIYRSVC